MPTRYYCREIELALSHPRPPRRMADVQDAQAVSENSVEHFIWIAHQRNDMDAGSLLHSRRSLRVFGDTGDDLADARFDCRGYGFAVLAAGSGGLAEIDQYSV